MPSIQRYRRVLQRPFCAPAEGRPDGHRRHLDLSSRARKSLLLRGIDVTGSDDAARREIVLRASDGSLIPVSATMNRLHSDDTELFCLILAI